VLYQRPTPGDIACGFFAVFPPPLAAFAVAGVGRDFWINLTLTFAGYLPGVIHAFWLIARR
jgi:uncharacterized membrane protein YqaE (UPF0057 family)